MNVRLVPTTCVLRQAAGRGLELCPGSSCGLWEDGCLVDRLQVPLRHDVASHLLELRLALEDVRDTTAEHAAHVRFFRRLSDHGD